MSHLPNAHLKVNILVFPSHKFASEVKDSKSVAISYLLRFCISFAFNVLIVILS